MSDTASCDVLIAGAGPAGLLLARLLAKGGASVQVCDPLVDLRSGAFSSAALPQTAIDQFQIPPHVQAAHWRSWQVFGPGSEGRVWSSPHSLGAVLDFGSLRQWLAEQAVAQGVVLQLGWSVQGWQPDGDGASVSLRGPAGVRRELHCRWLVDATGQRRALIGPPPSNAGELVSGEGVEWLLQVQPEVWREWADRLSFMLGSDWVPQGYGWVFPMAPGQLKLGVCRLHDRRREQPPLHRLLRRLQSRLELEHAQVLDRHGGLISSTIRRREPHQRGCLLAIGDAVSTGNLLGGEGIRHAMTSSAVLAPLLLETLSGRTRTLKRYPLKLRRRLGWRWSLSGRLAQRTWLSLHSVRGDRRLQRLLDGLEAEGSAEDLSALLFEYRFERYGIKALPYLLGWRRG